MMEIMKNSSNSTNTGTSNPFDIQNKAFEIDVISVCFLLISILGGDNSQQNDKKVRNK